MQHRQAVGATPGTHEMIGSRLARRIGRGWVVGRRLGELAGRAKLAEDFIGRDMMEAKGGAALRGSAGRNRRRASSRSTKVPLMLV